MWSLYNVLYLATLFHLDGSFGSMQEYQTQKCDIRIWHIDLMENVLIYTENRGNLKHTTKVLEKINRLVERATEETAFMPCSLLKTYSSIILPGVDIPLLEKGNDNRQQEGELTLKTQIAEENTASRKTLNAFDNVLPGIKAEGGKESLSTDITDNKEEVNAENSIESQDIDVLDITEEVNAENNLESQDTDVLDITEEVNAENNIESQDTDVLDITEGVNAENNLESQGTDVSDITEGVNAENNLESQGTDVSDITTEGVNAENNLESQDTGIKDTTEEVNGKYSVESQDIVNAGAKEERNAENVEFQDTDNAGAKEKVQIETNVDLQDTAIAGTSEEKQTGTGVETQSTDIITDTEEMSQVENNVEPSNTDNLEANDSEATPIYRADQIPLTREVEIPKASDVAEKIEYSVESSDTEFTDQRHEGSDSEEIPIYTADDIPLVEDIDKFQETGAEEGSIAAMPLNISSHIVDSVENPDDNSKNHEEANEQEKDYQIQNKSCFLADTDNTSGEKCISMAETVVSENSCVNKSEDMRPPLKNKTSPNCSDRHKSNVMTLDTTNKYLKESVQARKRFFMNKYFSHWCYNRHRRYKKSSKLICNYFDFGTQECINKLGNHSCIMRSNHKTIKLNIQNHKKKAFRKSLVKSCMQCGGKPTNKSSSKCHYINIWDGTHQSRLSKDTHFVIDNAFSEYAYKSATFDVKQLGSLDYGIQTESTPDIANDNDKNADDIDKINDFEDDATSVKQTEPIQTHTHGSAETNSINSSNTVTAGNNNDELSNFHEALPSDKKISENASNTSNYSEHRHNEIKRLVEVQQIQHDAKIQNLELMIVKLENKLLSRSLKQSENSNSVQNLENHILKIENELIKLNQTHQELQRENDALKSKQKKLSQMSVQANTSPRRSNYLALDDKSGNELMTQQRTRIMELSRLINNQSRDFHALQTKYQRLEEQNRQLFQTVMNQTALISLIMSQLDEINENNMKDRIKTQELQTHLRHFQEQEATRQSHECKFEKVRHQNSKTVHMQLPGHQAHDPRDGINVNQNPTLFTRVMLTLNSKRYLEAILEIVKLQTSMNIYSPRLCLYHNVIVSNIVPFSPLSWIKCRSIEGTLAFKAMSSNSQSGHNSESFKTNKNYDVADKTSVGEASAQTSVTGEINENMHVTEKTNESPAIGTHDGEKLNSDPLMFPLEDDEEVGFYEDNSMTNKQTEKDTQEDTAKKVGKGRLTNEDVVFFPIEDDENEDNNNKGYSDGQETMDEKTTTTGDNDNQMFLQNVDDNAKLKEDIKEINDDSKDMRVNVDDKDKVNEDGQHANGVRKETERNEKISKMDDKDKTNEDNKQTVGERGEMYNNAKNSPKQTVEDFDIDKSNEDSQQAESGGKEMNNDEDTASLQNVDEGHDKTEESNQTEKEAERDIAFKNDYDQNTGNNSGYPEEDNQDNSSNETDRDNNKSKLRDARDKGSDFNKDTGEDDSKHSEHEKGDIFQDIGDIDYDDRTLRVVDDINDDSANVDELSTKDIDQDNENTQSGDTDDESKDSDGVESNSMDEQFSDDFPQNSDNNNENFDQIESNQEKEEESFGSKDDTPIERILHEKDKPDSNDGLSITRTSSYNQENAEDNLVNDGDTPIERMPHENQGNEDSPESNDDTLIKRKLSGDIEKVENPASEEHSESNQDNVNVIEEDKYQNQRNVKGVHNKDSTKDSYRREVNETSENTSASNPRIISNSSAVNEVKTQRDEAISTDKQERLKDHGDSTRGKRVVRDDLSLEKRESLQKSPQENGYRPDGGRNLEGNKNNEKDDLNKASTVRNKKPAIASQLPTVGSKQTVEATQKSEENKKRSQSKDESQERDQEIAKDREKENNLKKKLLLLEAKRLKEALERPLLYKPEVTDPRPMDCHELYKLNKVRNGLNRIYVHGLNSNVSVMCEVKDETAWTVLLKRETGNVDFFRDFQAYKKGFGVLSAEHYIGNEKLHYLTNQKRYSLKVTLTNWEGDTTFALYKHFWTESEDNGYRLHLQGYSGTAGDGLGKHGGMKFSTYDVDNDLLKTEMGGSCAQRFKGAGWYYKCYMSNLMGVYYTSAKIPLKQFDGITWKPWLGPNYSMKKVVMSVHPLGE